MDDSRTVDMVRVPREEEYYDREEVLGRDASSVFPKEAAQAAEAGRDAMSEALGARKFISETELATIKATRGGAVDDGSVAADKPLAAILAERKAEKDAAFQENWRQMKTGKNRPLDPEEADFFEGLRRLKAEQETAARQEEMSELEAFREAVRAAAGSKGDGDAGAAAGADGPATAAEGEALERRRSGGAAASGGGAAAGAAPQPVKKAAPLIKPLIKVIPKGKRAAAGGGGAAAGGGGGGGSASGASGGGPAAAAAAGSEAKRQKTGTAQRSGSEGSGGEGSGGGGLAGLLGGYGSDDDSEGS
ncbi:MAG: hypothetical protein J3K34DRAFT_454496 [Monoraphidium minutum]|nr:MAG: hypothetical protein J3K34DRAFT_454496 [Monoraphidium minutum]